MSQYLTQDDLNALADLLVVSQKAKAREALCIKIGITYYKQLGFLYESSEDSFAINLINHLNDVGNTKAICQLCCKELEPIFQQGNRKSFLKEITGKLNCNQELRHNYPNPSTVEQLTSPTPSPSQSKKLNWLTGGAIFLLGLVGLAGFYKTDHNIVAIIGAVSAVIGAIIQAQSSSQTAQPKSARLRQIFFGAVVGLIFGVNIGSVAVNTINSQKPVNTINSQKSKMSPREINTDLPGEDYKILPWSSSLTPEICENACANESECRAWTFVRKGFRKENIPFCFLKKYVPEKERNKDCCISGVKE
jgi:hypothetical protein